MNGVSQIITTGDYQIRLLELDDGEFYLSLYLNEQLMQLVGDFSDPVALQKSFNQALRLNQMTPYKRLTYCIVKQGEKLGITSLIWSDEHEHETEIGTLVDAKFQHCGVAYQVMKALIQHAFQSFNVKKVYATFSAQNRAALKLVEKLDFNVTKAVDGFCYCEILRSNAAPVIGR